MNRSVGNVGTAVFRLCLAAVLLASAGASAQMTAITVPWVPTDTSQPHITYYGRTISLKGIARGGGSYYKWSYGDNTGDTGWVAFSDATQLGATHAYYGNPGQLYSATLSVATSSAGVNAVSAAYPIKMYLSTDLTDPTHIDVRAAVAEDEGLWYLHKTMNRSSAAGPYQNQNYGYWAGSFAGTCAALEAFELHGSKPLQSYGTDPYVDDTLRALNYVLANAAYSGVSSYSNACTPAGANGGSSPCNPDSNGNGIGIFLNSTDDIYTEGICAAAVGSSGAPGLVSVTGASSYVLGKPLSSIMQDVVDWFSYAQGDTGSGYGGWHYNANDESSADGSTNQWPIIGMLAATSNMGSTVPQFVKDRIPSFLNYTHTTDTSSINYGAYGYTVSGSYPNIAKTAGGMMGHYFVGNGGGNENLMGQTMFWNEWNNTCNCSWTNYNLGTSYAMYDVMKAMQQASPPLTKITYYTPGTLANSGNSFDWYYAPTTATRPGLAMTVVNQQNSAGLFTDTNNVNSISYTLNTAWDVLILLRAVSNVPPKAVICNCSAQWPVNSPVTLDGTCSVEPDQARTIPAGSGYQWDYHYNGTTFVQSLDTNNNPVQGAIVTKSDGFNKYTEDQFGNPLTPVVAFPVALKVTDNNPVSLGGPQSSITVCNVIIKPPPHCPQANIGGPYLGYAGVALQFDASKSTQVDNDPLTFAWDFHNANNFTGNTVDSTLVNPTFTFAANGTYPIELQVTNHPPPTSAGQTPSCSVVAYATVVVGQHPPVANAGGPYTAVPGETIQLDGTGSTDPDKTSGLTYTWDLVGDGKFTSSTSSKPNFTVAAATAVGTSYSVCLRVTNGYPLSSTPNCANVIVIAHHVPPNCVVANVGVNSCQGGALSVAVDGSLSNDPNLDHFVYAWTGGPGCPAFDNATAATPHLIFNTTAEGCTASCVATLTVTNHYGSNSCSQTVNIVDNLTPAFSTNPVNSTIECNANTAANVAAWLGAPGATEACIAPTRPVVISSDYRAGAGCGGVGAAGTVNGAVKVTFTGSDPCNTNTVQASATLTITDTLPPVLTLPGPTTAEATSASGAVVTYAATANDAATGPATITCTPPSGSTFPIGSTTVTCTSTDPTGHKATGTFIITISDTKAPVLTLPASFSAEATSAAGAPITYTATAADAVSGATSVTCSKASGSVFQIGATVVTCTSTDSHGNTASGQFTVTVADHSAPTITTPAGVTQEATSSAGATVSFAATATDAVSGATTVSCTPKSGAVFPIGSTTVTCTSSDTSGNAATKSFGIVVQDTTAPVFAGQTNGGTLTAEATSASGASVAAYSVTATDAVDGVTTVSCTPSAPQTFAVGTTPVSCTTHDSHGNVGNLSFSVAVVDTTPPVVTCPSDITIAANGPLGAINWNVSEPTSTAIQAFVDGAAGNDTVDPLPTLINNAPLLFLVGQSTAVTFTATDAHQNVGTCVAHVTVITEVETAPGLACPSSATLASGAGAEIDWSAVFHHPVAVQLLTVSGASVTLPLSVGPMADRSFQLSSAATASGAYAIRIRATDEVTGSAADCNRFLSVTPSVMPASKAQAKRTTIPAAAVKP